jgi:hypothetical protein
MSKLRTCQHCNYFETGPLDCHVNLMHCLKGHRLISDEQFINEHRPFDDPDEKMVQVTWDGWTESWGTGQAMLDRTDCSDWKQRSFKFSFTLGNRSLV